MSKYQVIEMIMKSVLPENYKVFLIESYLKGYETEQTVKDSIEEYN